MKPAQPPQIMFERMRAQQQFLIDQQNYTIQVSLKDKYPNIAKASSNIEL